MKAVAVMKRTRKDAENERGVGGVITTAPDILIADHGSALTAHGAVRRKI